MELEKISEDLLKIIRLMDKSSVDMNANEVALFLKKGGEALINYLLFANSKLDKSSEAFIHEEEVVRLRGLFEELSQNFFPVVNATEPLSNLKVVELNRFMRVIIEAEWLEDRAQNVLRNATKNKQKLIQLINHGN
jgi:hypothetical protein